LIPRSSATERRRAECADQEGQLFPSRAHRGALFGQLAVLIVGMFTAITLASATDPGALFAKFENGWRRMLTVYVPYAIIILIHVLYSRRAVGRHQKYYERADLRTFYFFIRPLVVLAGAVWGVVAAPGAITIAVTC
jgi:hypothetical protein